MLRLCKSPDRLWSESISLLGQTTDNIEDLHWKANFCGGPSNAMIPRGSTRTIVTPIHAGLFNTHYLLSGRFPVTIEIELVSSGAQCCARGDALAGGATAAKPGVFSQNFEIPNARILCDLVQCDVAIQNSFTEALAAGRPLQLALSSFSTTMHSIVANGPDGNLSWDVSLSRAYSRIKDLWVTLDNDTRGVWNTESNRFLSWHGKSGANENAALHLYGDSVPYVAAHGEGFRFQVSCGSLLFPDQPISSHAEAFYQLSKVAGMLTNFQGVSIPPGEYLASSHIVAIDLEKLYSTPAANFVRFTGLNTQSAGDTLRLTWQNVNPRSATYRPSRVYITLHYDIVLELRQEGALVLD